MFEAGKHEIFLGVRSCIYVPFPLQFLCGIVGFILSHP